jgi:acetyltransferase-like isoleucine patch superfamily enzyme
VCNGYPTRGPWPKTVEKPAPIPLQSKDGYEVSPSQYTQPGPYASQATPPSRREPLPGYRGQQLRVDPQHTSRSLGMEDDRPSASSLPSGTIGSPEHRMSAISYSQTVPFPTPVSANPPSAYPDRLSQNDYRRVPPLHDPSRQEHDTGTPQSAQSTLPHINILHPTHSNSPHPHTPQSTNLQNTAQLSLSQVASAGPGRQRTQKEEMLSGKQYFPFDRELVLERERCNAACWRFNSSTNPNNGVSQEERARQFRDILQPKELINISPTLASPISPSGYVGNNVVVEAPFTCDYGYNIHIGQDVAIGKNCTILDTCDVKIGDRCIIGPNVQIYTATLPIDPKRRLGSKGPNMGKPIVIEEDCWIGGGVIILPGRTIKRGSTVGAGSIVTRVRVYAFVFRDSKLTYNQDVPPFTVVCGNPARVTRGLYPPENQI